MSNGDEDKEECDDLVFYMDTSDDGPLVVLTLRILRMRSMLM